MLTELQHPNVVCLLGVVTQEQPVCMLFEFLPQGDLHEFLIMRSPHSDVGCSSDEDGTVKSTLDHGDFLHMATQVGGESSFRCAHANRSQIIPKEQRFEPELDILASLLNLLFFFSSSFAKKHVRKCQFQG